MPCKPVPFFRFYKHLISYSSKSFSLECLLPLFQTNLSAHLSPPVLLWHNCTFHPPSTSVVLLFGFEFWFKSVNSIRNTESMPVGLRATLDSIWSGLTRTEDNGFHSLAMTTDPNKSNVSWGGRAGRLGWRGHLKGSSDLGWCDNAMRFAHKLGVYIQSDWSSTAISLL